MTTLTPQIMFQGQMSEALALWGKAFADMTVMPKMQDGDRLVLAEVTIAGQTLAVFDSAPVHDFGFTPAISLALQCDSAEEVDAIFAVLSEGGTVRMSLGAYDFSERYAWIDDRFGVSWQLMVAP